MRMKFLRIMINTKTIREVNSAVPTRLDVVNEGPGRVVMRTTLGDGVTAGAAVSTGSKSAGTGVKVGKLLVGRGVLPNFRL